jgi:hypothetical protein
MSSTQIIREMRAFISTAPDSERKEKLLNSSAEFIKKQRNRRRVRQEYPVDRLPGIVAAAKYLLYKGVDLPLEQVTNSINERKS